MCFIVDCLLVKQIYIHLQYSYDLITSSVELSYYMDQEKVEVCMCLKKFMSFPLWQFICAQALQHEGIYNIRNVVLLWTKQERHSASKSETPSVWTTTTVFFEHATKCVENAF